MSQLCATLRRVAHGALLFATAVCPLAAAGPAAAGEPAPPPAERPADLDRFLAELGVPGSLDDATATPPLAAPGPPADLVTELAADAPADLPSDLAAALVEYAEGGEPTILGTPTDRVWPFGHGVPTLSCLPLRACDVALQSGETLLGWAIGDSERWRAEELTEGTPPTQRPHLLLKPTETSLATNLVLVTDRRTYHLELVSPSLEGDETEPTPYQHRVSWWYPDEWVRRLELRENQRADATADAAARHAAAVEIDRALDPASLSFAYRIERPFWPKRRLPWQPVTVFDDGERVYLRLPERARRHELPVLLGRLADGTTYPLATRLHGDWLVVPALFERAELVLGTGDRRRSLTLISTAEATIR